MIVGVQLFAVRHEQGRLDELVDIVAQRAAENPGIPTLQGTLAFTYSELGRIEDAAAIFERAARDDFAALPFDIAWTPGIARYAEVTARGDGEGARDLLERAAERARGHGGAAIEREAEGLLAGRVSA